MFYVCLLCAIGSYSWVAATAGWFVFLMRFSFDRFCLAATAAVRVLRVSFEVLFESVWFVYVFFGLNYFMFVVFFRPKVFCLVCLVCSLSFLFVFCSLFGWDRRVAWFLLPVHFHTFVEANLVWLLWVLFWIDQSPGSENSQNRGTSSAYDSSSLLPTV